MKIGIITDSSSGLEYVNFSRNVQVVRTAINFSDRSLIDGKDITADDFYDLLSNTKEIPSTSAPTPGAILEKAKILIDQGCTDIILFPISTGLSDYGKNIKNTMDPLLEDFGVNFHVYDSKQACLMEGLFAVYADYLAEKGKNVEEIFSILDDYRRRQTQYFLVDDLRYLVKSGRLNSVAGSIGILLKIKPILNINIEGKIAPYEKVRTYDKAKERLMDIIERDAKHHDNILYLSIHSKKPSECDELRKILDKKPNCFRTIVSTVTPTIGAHIGGGIIGVCQIQLNDDEVVMFREILNEEK